MSQAGRLSAAERRVQILRAATRCFAVSGYRGATTRQIADEAGIAEALIYRYFPTKQALFIESVRSTTERLVSGLEDILADAATSPLDALQGLVRFYRSLLRRHRDLARMVYVVSTELDDPALRAAYLPLQDRAVAALTDAIDRWQQNGLVRDDASPRSLAWLLLGSFQTVTLMKHTGRLAEVSQEDALKLAAAYLNAPALAPAAVEPAA